MNKIIRIIRTFHIEVDAEYGDTQEDLIDRGCDSLYALDKPDAPTPDDEQAMLMPDGADL